MIEKEFMQRKVAIEVENGIDVSGNKTYKTKILPANLKENVTYDEIIDYINHIHSMTTNEITQFKEIIEYKLNEV